MRRFGGEIRSCSAEFILAEPPFETIGLRRIPLRIPQNSRLNWRSRRGPFPAKLNAKAADGGGVHTGYSTPGQPIRRIPVSGPRTPGNGVARHYRAGAYLRPVGRRGPPDSPPGPILTTSSQCLNGG